MAKQIKLYSAQLCGDCQHLKAFMDANGVEYEVRDIRENPGYADELREKNRQGRGPVPRH